MSRGGRPKGVVSLKEELRLCKGGGQKWVGLQGTVEVEQGLRSKVGRSLRRVEAERACRLRWLLGPKDFWTFGGIGMPMMPWYLGPWCRRLWELRPWGRRPQDWRPQELTP